MSRLQPNSRPPTPSPPPSPHTSPSMTDDTGLSDISSLSGSEWCDIGQSSDEEGSLRRSLSSDSEYAFAPRHGRRLSGEMGLSFPDPLDRAPSEIGSVRGAEDDVETDDVESVVLGTDDSNMSIGEPELGGDGTFTDDSAPEEPEPVEDDDEEDKASASAGYSVVLPSESNLSTPSVSLAGSVAQGLHGGPTSLDHSLSSSSLTVTLSVPSGILPSAQPPISLILPLTLRVVLLGRPTAQLADAVLAKIFALLAPALPINAHALVMAQRPLSGEGETRWVPNLGEPGRRAGAEEVGRMKKADASERVRILVEDCTFSQAVDGEEGENTPSTHLLPHIDSLHPATTLAVLFLPPKPSSSLRTLVHALTSHPATTFLPLIPPSVPRLRGALALDALGVPQFQIIKIGGTLPSSNNGAAEISLGRRYAGEAGAVEAQAFLDAPETDGARALAEFVIASRKDEAASVKRREFEEKLRLNEPAVKAANDKHRLMKSGLTSTCSVVALTLISALGLSALGALHYGAAPPVQLAPVAHNTTAATALDQSGTLAFSSSSPSSLLSRFMPSTHFDPTAESSASLSPPTTEPPASAATPGYFQPLCDTLFGSSSSSSVKTEPSAALDVHPEPEPEAEKAPEPEPHGWFTREREPAAAKAESSSTTTAVSVSVSPEPSSDSPSSPATAPTFDLDVSRLALLPHALVERVLEYTSLAAQGASDVWHALKTDVLEPYTLVFNERLAPRVMDTYTHAARGAEVAAAFAEHHVRCASIAAALLRDRVGGAASALRNQAAHALFNTTAPADPKPVKDGHAAPRKLRQLARRGALGARRARDRASQFVRMPTPGAKPPRNKRLEGSLKAQARGEASMMARTKAKADKEAEKVKVKPEKALKKAGKEDERDWAREFFYSFGAF